MIKFPNLKMNVDEPKGTKIEVWYDKNTRSWVTELTDKNGYQVGKADYTHSKREALKIVESLKKEHDITEVKIFKRNSI